MRVTLSHIDIILIYRMGQKRVYQCCQNYLYTAEQSNFYSCHINYIVFLSQVDIYYYSIFCVSYRFGRRIERFVELKNNLILRLHKEKEIHSYM